MASISSNYYNFSSSLFGTASSSSAGSSSNILGDYYSIKNGSYKKLLSAYYKKQNGESTSNSTEDKNVNTDSTSSDKTKLTLTKTNADGLKTAASALTSTGKNSLFEKVTKTVTDATTGTTSEKTDYDMDKIASAISSFAKSYNDTIKSAAETDSTSVLRKTAYMVSMTNANKNLLAKVGVTIGSDNTLSVDETKIKNANMNDLKTLFNGTDSYADRVNSKAVDISTASVNALYANRLYGANGKYSTAGITGTLFNQYL